MNIIDHRILVPKSSQLVWDYISSINKNPEWQVDCDSISMLTSRQAGVGVRWRQATPGGRESVAEITAWYDGLGYEYTFVDGVPYRENKGRIRLQEIPEGTVIQWTFNYETGGVLSGIRNAVIQKRQIENGMVDSLNALWRILNQLSDNSEREVKSLIREAPDYEARSQYKPRHHSVVTDEGPGAASIEEVIQEPPISDEDTRPHPSVEGTDAEAEDDNGLIQVKDDQPLDEPKIDAISGFNVNDEPEVIRDDTETENAKLFPVTEVLDPSPVVPSSPITDVPSPDENTVNAISVELSDSSEIDFLKAEEVVTDEVFTSDSAVATVPDKKVEAVEEIKSSPENPTLSEQTKTDTGDISVFEMFGVPKPSETQEMQAIPVMQQAVESSRPNRPTRLIKRTGFRLKLRRNRAKLRWPQ